LERRRWLARILEEGANALRTLDKVFYFYREIGQPLGATSKSLSEFAAIVKGIDPASIRFHVEWN
jgi:hypothetical protein